jgi:hypothetical protein
MTRSVKLSFRLALLVITSAVPAAAQTVPPFIPFSAHVQNTATPAPTEVEFVFRIYNVPEDGEALWTETQVLNVVNGEVSTLLGLTGASPLGVFDGSLMFMELQVAGTVLTPRTVVGSVPYAVRSAETDHAQRAESALSADRASQLGPFLPDDLQRKITGQCPAFSAVTGVATDGSLVCGYTDSTPGGGLPGPQGATGASGPTGPQGLPGGTGVRGATGPEGPAGPVGTPGALGPSGPAGNVGATGPVGLTGATGPTGLTGATGPAGDTGPTGLMGLMGPAGEVGATGAVGPTGVAGATGPEGPTGTAGAVGATGPVGPTGVAGATGAAGTNALWAVNGTNMVYNGGGVGIGATPNGLLRVAGAVRMGSETGTAGAPTDTGDSGFSYTGVVTRRVASGGQTLGNVVARTHEFTLERDGTPGGIRIQWAPNNSAIQTVRGIALRNNGTQMNIATGKFNEFAGGTRQVFLDADDVVYVHLIIGNMHNLSHATEITMARSGAVSSGNWVGFMHSTFNQ